MPTWRNITDWAKRRPFTLRLADRLGRGRGRMRVFDRLSPPPPAPVKPDLSNWHEHDLAGAWIGHATVLLRVGNTTILTDPVFSNRVGVGLGLITGGPRRLLAPALKVTELPPIDLILISHAHFDHLDRPTLNKLPRSIPVITAQHTRDLIRDLGFRQITELSWGQSASLRALTVTAHPAAHWGARTFQDAHRGFNAYLLESAGRRVLYAGDTAHTDSFRPLGKVDLAIFGIGGYNPFVAAHATPEQAWDMTNQVSADVLLPMHHSTFRLSHEPPHEPMQRLLEAAGTDSARIVVKRVGEMWSR